MKNLFLFLTMIIVSSNSFGQQNIKTVKDIDGNVYNTVTIGSQVWMKENLKTTKYRDGNLIGTTTPATLDISEESTPKYQWSYDGRETNVATYGRLYTCYAVIDSRGICPTGWHVSTDAEWIILTTYLGGDLVASDKLKEAGTTHWISTNTRATNSSGFTALPGGYRLGDGTFSFIGKLGAWWSSPEISTSTAWYHNMGNNTSYVDRDWDFMTNGLSVRCIRDN